MRYSNGILNKVDSKWTEQRFRHFSMVFDLRPIRYTKVSNDSGAYTENVSAKFMHIVGAHSSNKSIT